MQNSPLSLTEGSSGNRRRLEFKLSLLNNFYSSINLRLVNVTVDSTLSLTQISSGINLSLFSGVSLTWGEGDREVMFKCGSDLMTPAQTWLLLCSSPLTCDQHNMNGSSYPLHSILSCYGINHSLESQTWTEWVSLGHAKHSLESGVWCWNRDR